MQSFETSIADKLRNLVSRQQGGESSPSDAVLIGLIGRSIQSSRTPMMHEREGARLGMCYTYILIDFDVLALRDESLSAVVAAAGDIGFAGLNVTHPFKQRIIPLLSGLEPQAEAIGAVNTVVFRNGRIIGHNTDSWGFATSFRNGMAGCSLKRVIQFGAGGAGAAVAYALLGLGAENLAVVDTDLAKSRELASRMAARFGRPVSATVADPAAVRAATGIVNTTPIGMAKYPGVPFPTDWLSREQWVSDIIYFPQETELLRQAQVVGCRVLPGTGMAIYQAVRAFELFTGVAADPAAMISHFEAA